jgi:hypothetical protein
MSNQQEQMIRNSLWNSVFADYSKLIQTIKTLPYDQNIPGFQKSLSFIDDGIVWAKEVIMSSPVLLKSQEQQPQPEVQEPAPTNETPATPE